MSETIYSLIFVTEPDSQEMIANKDVPDGVRATYLRSSELTDYSCSSAKKLDDPTIIWVVKGYTKAVDFLLKNAKGRISDYSSPGWIDRMLGASGRELLRLSDVISERNTYISAKSGVLDAGMINGAPVINNYISNYVKPSHGATTLNPNVIKAPAEPRTTLVTQLEVDSFPAETITTALTSAIGASSLSEAMELPSDGMVTLKWEPVVGRDSLRKFSVTVDYKDGE